MNVSFRTTPDDATYGIVERKTIAIEIESRH